MTKYAKLMGMSRLSHSWSSMTKLGRRRTIARDAAITLAGIAAEEDGAGVTGTGDAALLEFEQMLVDGRERCGAEFADRGLRTRFANESLQGRE